MTTQIIDPFTDDRDAFGDYLSAFDAAYDAEKAEEARQEEDDYIFVRDETLSVIADALKDWDVDEDVEHPAHRVVMGLQASDILDPQVPARLVCQTVAGVLVNFSEIPTLADYESLFEVLNERGWVHA